MGAIKLPVRVEARVEVVEDVLIFAVVDADEDVLFFCESREEADEIATALNPNPALIAERDGLREALAEMVAASDPDTWGDEEALSERCCRALDAARAALRTGGK